MPKGDTNHFWLEAEQELRQEAAEQMEQQGGLEGLFSSRLAPDLGFDP